MIASTVFSAKAKLSLALSQLVSCLKLLVIRDKFQSGKLLITAESKIDRYSTEVWQSIFNFVIKAGYDFALESTKLIRNRIRVKLFLLEEAFV